MGICIKCKKPLEIGADHICDSCYAGSLDGQLDITAETDLNASSEEISQEEGSGEAAADTPLPDVGVVSLLN